MTSILLVDDDIEFTGVACKIIELMGYKVASVGTIHEAKESLHLAHYDHILLDFMLPDGSGLHLLEQIQAESSSSKVTFITGHPLIKNVIAELCGPKINYLLKPLKKDDLEDLFNSSSHAKKPLKNAPIKHFDCLIGESASMKELYKMIERVSQTHANVMLMGESGVGKEVVAQAIHSASQVTGALVTTNCGAFSKELLGSELFGHEKGAFTGAVNQKKGVFEQAEQGTLFLDELTEMPIDMQPSLLRVLESKKITRVGGTKELPVNCRVISATNRPIEEIAQNNILREDIYFRLAVFPISIPSLKERKTDIPLLAQAFLDDLNTESDRKYTLKPEQIDTLMDYDWPGNVRELRHTIHRAFIMSDPENIDLELPDNFASPFSESQKATYNVLTAGQKIEDLEKELIFLTLEKVSNNKTLAAEMLGISTKTLYNRLHSYGHILD
ncbi:sigma-54-dependent transcriptional regulator [Marinomonas algicola]|uniref:sigma-54-dependent transcriptional regulator n=1 Tax=Marinomonas algicola TaxID=2773454 RepID=UPI00174BE36D|nr:sigma-54 dependent transcriptional regulator [Marinomonas algicola]